MLSQEHWKLGCKMRLSKADSRRGCSFIHLDEPPLTRCIKPDIATGPGVLTPGPIYGLSKYWVVKISSLTFGEFSIFLVSKIALRLFCLLTISMCMPR